MWKVENRAHFVSIVGDMLEDENVQSMKDLPQHSKFCNCYEHSLYVSYLSFLICRRLGWNYAAAARGGLLHDFYLCKWEENSIGLRRLWRHPKMALDNAKKQYELTPLEEDIIVKHMWPLTPRPPRHRESFVVSFADKLCALMEFSWLYRAFKVKKNLAAALG